MGSDVLDLRNIHLKRISIHAPAWGATRGSAHPIRAIRISIHAPAWGATGRPRPSRTPPTYFNPRSRMGSDVNAIMHGELSSENFNPRSRMGSDRSRRALRVDRRGFQSTLPHGERRELVQGAVRPAHISIHAPAWGATHERGVALADVDISIHAPAWGATCGMTMGEADNVFQSTLPHGERHRGGAGRFSRF